MDRRLVVVAAAGLLAAENVALLAGVLLAGSAPVGVVFLLLAKFPLCAALLRQRLWAAGLLILWETATMAVALVNTALTPLGQVALFASAVTGSSLVALSLPLFAPAPQGRLP